MGNLLFFFVFLFVAQKTFEDDSVSVAIGPYINHFTSPEYIITTQSHYLTTSLAGVRKSADKTRIRVLWPDPSGFTWAVAQLMDKLHWNKIVFLSDSTYHSGFLSVVVLLVDAHIYVDIIKFICRNIYIHMQ